MSSRPIPRLPPWWVLLALAAGVAILSFGRPLAGADPYHLQRVAQIARLHSFAYDPGAADLRINVQTGEYELLLAVLAAVPVAGPWLIRSHGLLGLGLLTLAVATAQAAMGIRRRWLLTALFIVPVVFHQFVLVKNDLFAGLPAFVALVWVVTRPPACRLEIFAIAFLAGAAMGVKLTNAPVPFVVAAFLVWPDPRDWWRWLPVLAGVAAGAIAAGFGYTLMENARVYGSPLAPYGQLGNRNTSVGETAVSLGRFVISLFDLGLITRRVWPGRGGWAGTFGLPLIWAFAALWTCRARPDARRAALAGAACLAAFAATYPDADLAHRMVIGPGLMLIATALRCVDVDDDRARWLRRGLIPVLALTALQMMRSAVAYLR